MIFLDVGAHEGQTLEEAVRYEFDRVYAFEPMPTQFARLVERFGGLPHVELLNVGLADTTGRRLVYGTNDELEASIYPGKEDVGDTVTECDFVAASEFFADLPDRAFLKLNCEGAEIPILNNLIDTGEIRKVESALVDFDVRRIPGMEHEEQQVLVRLGAIGFGGLVLCEDAVPDGRELRRQGRYRYTRRDEIMCWLKSKGIAER